jgi:hypothetical protein
MRETHKSGLNWIFEVIIYRAVKCASARSVGRRTILSLLDNGISIEIVSLSRFNRLNNRVIRTLSRNKLLNRISKREIFIVKESAVFCAASRFLKWNNA